MSLKFKNSHLKKLVWLYYIELIEFSQILSLVTGNDWSSDSNTFSLPVYNSNCIWKLMKINSQKWFAMTIFCCCWKIVFPFQCYTLIIFSGLITFSYVWHCVYKQPSIYNNFCKIINIYKIVLILNANGIHHYLHYLNAN